jgi:predicted Zn-dependent protease
MKFLVAWRRTMAVAIVALLVITAFAEKNVYDKFRNREYTNKGYISEEEELKLAEEVHKQLLGQVKLVRNSPLNTYIDTLGNKLARTSERSNIPWKFYVVDDGSINAFATLGGRVYVHTGLIAKANSEAQLASVMGHEIGHIVGRHGLENVKKAGRYQTLAGIATIAGAVLGGQGGAGLGNLASNLILGGKLMKHSRDAEREADYLGLYNMKQAGYNTGGMIEMFQILSKINQSQPDALGSIMASHPKPEERADNTRVEIDQRLRGTDQRGISNTKEYQQIKGGTVGPMTPRRVQPPIRPRN